MTKTEAGCNIDNLFAVRSLFKFNNETITAVSEETNLNKESLSDTTRNSQRHKTNNSYY